LVEFNRRVFVYEEDLWAVKGRFETALENDDDVLWAHDNGQDILRLLIVSPLLFNFTFFTNLTQI
jgi:hypothetical protein